MAPPGRCFKPGPAPAARTGTTHRSRRGSPPRGSRNLRRPRTRSCDRSDGSAARASVGSVAWRHPAGGYLLDIKRLTALWIRRAANHPRNPLKSSRKARSESWAGERGCRRGVEPRTRGGAAVHREDLSRHERRFVGCQPKRRVSDMRALAAGWDRLGHDRSCAILLVIEIFVEHHVGDRRHDDGRTNAVHAGPRAARTPTRRSSWADHPGFCRGIAGDPRNACQCRD